MIRSSEVILVCLYLLALNHYCASSESNVISSTKTVIQENFTHLDTKSALNSSSIINDSNLLSSKDHTHQGREHVTVGSSTNSMNNLKALATQNSSNSSNNSSASNGMDSSRTSKAGNVSNSNLIIKNNTINKSNTVVNSTSSIQKSTVARTVPTKPMRTVHDDLSYSIESKQAISHTDRIPNIDTYAQKRNRRADYVVPIVAVILSVPLVAILISVLYKRSTDWWQHRNYRRMDFLIEGMYNN